MSVYFAFLLAFLYMASFSATRMLVILYALKLGAQPLAIGLLAATFTLFPMLLSWQVGRILDRYGPRWLLTLSAAGCACGLLLPYFVPALAALFALGALSGLTGTFFNLSMQNLVGRVSDASNRTRNYSNIAMSISVANVVGPALAGLSIDHLGHAYTFLGVAGLVAVLVLLLLIWGRVLPGGRRDSAPARGVRRLLANPLLWPVLVASSSAQSGLDVFQIYMPVYGNAQGLSASEIGVIVSMCAAGGFLSRIILTRLVAWSSEVMVLAYALFLGALSFVAVPFLHAAAGLAVIAFVFGFGLNCSQPLVLTMLFSRLPEGRAGEALGLRFSLDNGVKCVGPVVFGVAASAFGVGAVFWINAMMLTAGGAITRFHSARPNRE